MKQAVAKKSKKSRIVLTDQLKEKFIEACMNLDASIVEPFIPEDMELNDLEKYDFLNNLDALFEKIWKMAPEDWRVEACDYVCGFCNRGKPLAAFSVFSGISLVPYARFGYFVEQDKKGNTKDIYVCHSLHMAEFFGKTTQLSQWNKE